MAALLHQAALPGAQPHPWPLSSVRSHPPLHLAPLSKRQQRVRLQAAAADSGTSTGAAAPPPPKKVTRKEKQLDRRRQQDVQQRQEQLVMEASSPSPPPKPAGGGKGYAAGGDGGDDDELPQPVFDRILRRIMVTVGVPMASGVALLNVYDALKRGQGVEVPSWLPLLTILVAFGTSALGIAYGTVSASWDPDREGSLLGIEEARANWPVLWEEEIEKEKAKAKQKKK